MVRMGARGSLIEVPTPPGYRTDVVSFHDRHGRLQRTERHVVLDVVQFVDLDDGRRISIPPGKNLLAVPPGGAPDLPERVREFIHADSGLPDSPLWQDMLEALRHHGVGADRAALAALPFVVELDDEVRALAG
jgi:hypothetical protein